MESNKNPCETSQSSFLSLSLFFFFGKVHQIMKRNNPNASAASTANIHIFLAYYIVCNYLWNITLTKIR